MAKAGAANPFSSDLYLMPPYALNDYQLGNDVRARWSRYETYLSFYGGAQWFERRRPGERRITINYARAFIQKQASYLMGKPVTFELIPNKQNKSAEAAAANAEVALKQIWDDNGLAQLDYEQSVNAAILGDGGFKVTLQPGEDDPLAVGSVGSAGRVVVRGVDMSCVDAGYKYGDLRCLSWVNEQWRCRYEEAVTDYGEPRLHAAGLGPAIQDDNGFVEVLETWTQAEYQVFINHAPIIQEPNPYGFIPYVLFPNRSVPRIAWGESDLEDVMQLASELNVRVSVLSQLLQMSGNPVLVLENVDSSEGIQVGPGAVWNIPEGAKASLLEMLRDGTVQLHRDYIGLIYQMLHDLSEAPAIGFGRDTASLGASSGVALDLMLHPVAQRVNRKRRIWDEVLDRRNRMMLKLAGLPLHRSKINWPDVLPKDRARDVTDAVGLASSNIWSLETARRSLGMEQPEKETERILAEQQALAALGVGVKSKQAGAGAGGLFNAPPVKVSGALINGLSNAGV